jgi:hypothetical protein
LDGVTDTTVEAASDSYLQANRTVHINHGTARPVLLLELGLVGFQHADFPPPVKKQRDRCYPENKYQEHY